MRGLTGLLVMLFVLVLAGSAIADEWVTGVVDSEGSTGWFSSLALDSSGNPHISYGDGTNTNLEFARWDGSDWQIETVDTDGDVGRYTSLALDSSGNPHISYQNWSTYDLKYTRWDGSHWQIDIVDSGGDVGFFTSLALDSSDAPHISYRDYTNEGLKYAWYGDDSGIKSVELTTQLEDEGVLLSWSIVGDESATVSVLRGLTQNGSVDISGELSGSATSWLDVSAEAGVEYAYWLEVTELDGTVSCFGPSEVVVQGAISELTLRDPYPNPASDSLTISYELATNGSVGLSVYDLSGRLVETLVSGEQTAGRHSVSWDSSTLAMATGVYLIRLEAAGEAITKRAVISR